MCQTCWRCVFFTAQRGGNLVKKRERNCFIIPFIFLCGGSFIISTIPLRLCVIFLFDLWLFPFSICRPSLYVHTFDQDMYRFFFWLLESINKEKNWNFPIVCCRYQFSIPPVLSPPFNSVAVVGTMYRDRDEINKKKKSRTGIFKLPCVAPGRSIPWEDGQQSRQSSSEIYR